MKRALCIIGLTLLTACSSTSGSDDTQDTTEDALSTSASASLRSGYNRVLSSPSDPIRGLIISKNQFGRGDAFALDLDPNVVSGLCDPGEDCEPRVEGKVSGFQGTATQGRFKLVGDEYAPPEAAPYLGAFTFVRQNGERSLSKVGSSFQQVLHVATGGYCVETYDCDDQVQKTSCEEFRCNGTHTCEKKSIAGCDPDMVPLKYLPGQFNGTWQADSDATPYAILELSESSISAGTFTGTAPGSATPITGTYAVTFGGGGMMMPEIALWKFTESGGATRQAIGYNAGRYTNDILNRFGLQFESGAVLYDRK